MGSAMLAWWWWPVTLWDSQEVTAVRRVGAVYYHFMELGDEIQAISIRAKDIDPFGQVIDHVEAVFIGICCQYVTRLPNRM